MHRACIDGADGLGAAALYLTVLSSY